MDNSGRLEFPGERESLKEEGVDRGVKEETGGEGVFFAREESLDGEVKGKGCTGEEGEGVVF